MATRLDRLFLLLETGSTPVVRRSAAEQLGEVQRLHPHELNNLLSKVHTYLCSSSWDTRIAAGQAVQAIAKHVPQWNPKPAVHQENVNEPEKKLDSRFSVLSQFDIRKVLQKGASLLGSAGKEYELEDTATGLDQKERLSKQRQLLNKRLGLDVAGGLGMQTTDLFADEDLVTNGNRDAKPGPSQVQVGDLVEQQMLSTVATGDMSSREINKAKRKAKLLAKQISRDFQTNGGSNNKSLDEPAVKLRKTSSVVVDQPADDNKVVIDNVPNDIIDLDELDDWQFESFCEVLTNDLFNPLWEVRHGAAIGLREIMKLHGAGAGKLVNRTLEELHTDNQSWLEDLSVRLCCVLALDKFGDYVSDEVVAPVRENCAQTLGVVLRHMAPSGIAGVLGIIMQLLGQAQWEVRHGGLLGLKYMLAVRQDMTSQLLPSVMWAVYAGLNDGDDDVRAVAAAALLPVIDSLINTLPMEVPKLILCLWDILLDLDDLTASTNSVMTLLSALLSKPLQSTSSLSNLQDLVPRLWPFLRHNISSVRRASLDTLHTILCQSGNTSDWLPPILLDTLRHIYQRALLEYNDSLLEHIYKVWCAVLEKSPLDILVQTACPWLNMCLCQMMQPLNTPFDPNFIIQAQHRTKDMCHSSRGHQTSENPAKKQQDYIAGYESFTLLPADRDIRVIRSRLLATRMLGQLSFYITKPVTFLPEGVELPIESLAKLLVFHLTNKSAVQRFTVAEMIIHWTKDKILECPDVIKSKLLECANEAIYFDEIALMFARLQNECKDFMAGLKQAGVDVQPIINAGAVLTLDQATLLATTVYESVKNQIKPKAHIPMFDSRCSALLNTVTQTSKEQQILSIRVQGSIAGTLVILNHLPEKLNPVVRPLMDIIKKEENVQLQKQASERLALLIEQCCKRSQPPTAKIMKNLCTFLCSDTTCTPSISTSQESLVAQSPYADMYSGILTLDSISKNAEKSAKSTRGRKPLALNTDSICTAGTPENSIQRRGAQFALTALAGHFGDGLADEVPSFWVTAIHGLSVEEKQDSETRDKTEAIELVNSLQVLETIASSLTESLLKQVLARLPQLCSRLNNPFSAVRHMASRCLGMLSRIATSETLSYTLEHILPLLSASHNDTKRLGAIEAVTNIINALEVEIVPYVVLLVVPVLGCMSDQNIGVRLMATQCFATLIRYMPLEAGVPDPPKMAPKLIEQKDLQRKFLEQLLDGSKIDDYKVPIPIKAELRKYQQDGVNWLAFLNKYKLHGILCDDMGLGKTLQSICILAGDHFNRQQKYKEVGSEDCKPLPSIVVCPPTLTGHWVYEVEKFVSPEHLHPLHYTGPPNERLRLQKEAKQHNLVVASYDIVRNDIEFFSTLKWNYCILDEGHIIKNGKTKISKAVKQLNCNHRVILSGTPIQNNVLELWSLFDFLLPGFLGSEKQFNARYGKPILQSRDAKSSSRDQEAGALAMDALHRQVLPFLLRRLKEDVLQDLPPKIIQDYYCDLSPLQVTLYEDFSKSRAKQSVDDGVRAGQTSQVNVQTTTHVFQALQYLRKVCNHPSLVLTNQHPQYKTIMQNLRQTGVSLNSIQHAAKLVALKQLLLDCGIGEGSEESPVVNQHRVLLFCQQKTMLDIIEKDLFKSHMPSVTYSRLDGTVPAGNRHSLVSRFNNDPSIDVLLLTTHVGGLGLNLTGADTVIFVEHDWNPMKDLQAMDRAHRIGQKKVVNVYRLITRGTLEEKIMGLQKFKLNIANTVISQENSSLQTMGTDQLLDLFSLDNKTKGSTLGQKSDESKSVKQESMAKMLDNLGELWDEKQYDNEYDLSSFMKSLS
ncbi:unnamed protein product [Owenia fusiformis]|uniref:Uncharacterized protein n=1 Tax=Owenia fusiformis TaxID=6347 RepID=A0A8J1U8W8_OWEFU|nr:unnamed protein product [Owenia fusiformis]